GPLNDEAAVSAEKPSTRTKAALPAKPVSPPKPASSANAVSKPASEAAPASAGRADRSNPSGQTTANQASRWQQYVVGYAIAMTCLLLYFLVTGRLSLFGSGTLDNLPDLKPLDSNEFRKVMIPDEGGLPESHVLMLGQSRRFGDIGVKPTRVTREPLTFAGFLNNQVDDSRTTRPLLKLWLELTSFADGYVFPPLDSHLMSSRSPAEGVDDSTLANSFLVVRNLSEEPASRRVLNFLHPHTSNFVMVGQEAGRSIAPNETLLTFIACSEQIDDIQTQDDTEYSWRLQIRKGVHVESGHGVTTLVEVRFTEADIQPPAQSSATEDQSTARIRLTSERTAG
ncbi:MAG: hypothetical protein KDA91_19640, partial [Planctomycetaceae bacterium]|nr:hypothetical protein [Planctomycetaceae bacterium]